MSFGMHQHQLELVENPAEIGGFLAETLGYNLAPATSYAQNLEQLERKVFRIIPEIPRQFDPEDGVDDVEEVEYLVNIARASIFGLVITQDKSDKFGLSYSIITHCMGILAVTQSLGNLEDWIEWAAKEFNVDLSQVGH